MFYLGNEVWRQSTYTSTYRGGKMLQMTILDCSHVVHKLVNKFDNSSFMKKLADERRNVQCLYGVS